MPKVLAQVLVHWSKRRGWVGTRIGLKSKVIRTSIEWNVQEETIKSMPRPYWPMSAHLVFPQYNLMIIVRPCDWRNLRHWRHVAVLYKTITSQTITDSAECIAVDIEFRPNAAHKCSYLPKKLHGAWYDGSPSNNWTLG